MNDVCTRQEPHSHLPSHEPGQKPAFEIETRGHGLRSFLSVLERLRGRHVLARTVALLTPDLQQAIRDGALRGDTWQPIAWSRELHRAVRTATHEGPELNHLIGYESVRQDFAGALCALTFVLSPEALIRRAPRIFRTYFRSAQMYVVDAEPGRVRVHWSGCSGFDRNVWNSVFGGCEAVLNVCGGRGVHYDVLSGAEDGASSAVIEAFWS